ncbi:hypothetical protein RRG08_040165 [Elysia crispata]|uniref:Uncharacterized protein n=1 Tax=Elysia crispata TaxID=231223 RepID=A0AAE0XWJ3_9GAST|nr:hypothetical protein RRG08_040165 [Elysia crispata]
MDRWSVRLSVRRSQIRAPARPSSDGIVHSIFRALSLAQSLLLHFTILWESEDTMETRDKADKDRNRVIRFSEVWSFEEFGLFDEACLVYVADASQSH